MRIVIGNFFDRCTNRPTYSLIARKRCTCIRSLIQYITNNNTIKYLPIYSNNNHNTIKYVALVFQEISYFLSFVAGVAKNNKVTSSVQSVNCPSRWQLYFVAVMIIVGVNLHLLTDYLLHSHRASSQTIWRLEDTKHLICERTCDYCK